MPELPEVETTIRGLRQVLEGQILTHVEPRRADLRRAIPPDLRQRLTGARVTALGRRAKYGLIETDRGDTLIFHLGMSGRWRVDPPEIGKHDHLLIETGEGRRLALHDPRRFGSLDIVASDEMASFAPFVGLGPEPLGPDLTAAHLAAKFEGRIAPVKPLLLDQRIVAGLGNIYVCEALNIAGIAPTRPAGAISRARLDRLVPSIRAVLEAAILAGGSTLRDFAQPDGELGYFASQFRVYGREGEACPCGGTVKRRVDGGRSTFHCPRCQR
jgi:formamidopyrimidine-DNA glycosylase